jgi:hypothetical protein
MNQSGENPGLVVRAEAHFQDVMGSNPAVYWMDVSMLAVTYSMKKEIKVAKWGTPKKIIIMIIFF